MKDRQPFEVLPPIGGWAPAFVCARVVQDEPYRLCGKLATWHVMWTANGENGLVCGEHEHEARWRWAFFAIHPYEVTCSVPGAIYFKAANACRVHDTDWP